MKRLILLIVFYSLLIKGYSQTFKTVGVNAGVTVSRLEWELRQNSGFPVEALKTKWTAGYFVQINTNLIDKRVWAFNTSLGVVQKNGNYIDEYYAGNQSEEPHKLTYVSFTNLLKGKIGVSEVSFFTGHLGPRVDYLIAHSDNITRFAPYGGNYFYYADDDLRRVNIGLNSGIGFQVEMKNKLLGIEVSKNINFNKIYHATGPRLDGNGDEGFFLTLNDNTFIINLLLSWRL
ncbi:MAG: outer membrane beta-barrel protein [Cyclobacteriaceae bacterium]|nr:outer membrane beta-barrel protein [Cyclobacteriaceae bacterium]